MHSEYRGFILLGACCLCVVFATMDPNPNVKKAAGWRTCQRLCLRITDCSCNLYLTSDTTCHPRGIGETQQNPEMSEKITNCIQDGQTHRTRGRIMQCRPSLERLLPYHVNEERKEEEMTKLLMLPNVNSNSHPLQGRQLFLSNNIVVPYPFIQVNCTSSVAYISSLRKLVVATLEPRELFLSPLYQRKKDVVKANILVEGLAVDETKQLVFVTSKSPNHGVNMMTTDGKNFTLLFNLQCYFGTIAADHKRSLIYVPCYKHNILRFTYQGIAKGAMPAVHKAYLPISIDPEADNLYFVQQTRKTIFKMSLSDHRVTKLTTITTNVISLFATNNTVYVSPGGERYVLAINGFRTVTKINMGYKLTVQGVYMCTTP